MSDDLLLDPDIRLWVFLPMVLITFLSGILRHYVSILLQSPKKIELQQVIDGQMIRRSRLLRENGHLIPKQVCLSFCLSFSAAISDIFSLFFVSPS